ncbi:hypothetical protein UPYG_G00131050 [Umbra pygmaea]|uniref:non-specific serine/threonine protein kinase n=1 Tax=Umbra pygmaea TaxID=75934 RepID=A0ABD0XE05_UMBPY
MDNVNYIAKLYEYAQKTHLISDIKFHEVCTEGPDHLKTFSMQVVIKGCAYPIGVGRTKKEAKQNAAKHALDGIVKIVQDETTSSSSERPHSSDPLQVPCGAISQANFVCWLNEHSQKNRLILKAIEGTRIGSNSTSQCCRYVLSDKQYPEAFGKTKKEAKEEAAKLVHQELYGGQATVKTDDHVSGPTEIQKEDLNKTVATLCDSVESLNISAVPRQCSLTSTDTNYIGILNHYCQKTRLFLDFNQVEMRGPSHDPEFVYKVVIDKREYPPGTGKTAKEAKQQAAQHAWSALQEQSDWNSQVSCRSTGSEDGGTFSLSSSTAGEAQDATSSCQTTADTDSMSDSIIFTDSTHVEMPKQEENPGNVKHKIKLAANFKMSPNKTEKENTNLKGNNLGTTSSGRMSDQPFISRFLSEFDSIERIGKGGFGSVYKAKRILEQRNYAVKIVRSKTKAKREVGALAGLQHPNIVRYYTAWEDESEYRCDNTSDSYSSSCSGSSSSSKFLYIQMELCDLKNLKVWIDERNAHRMPNRREESLYITQQIVNGVEYIHSKKLIHRDLKPPNIMFGMSDKGLGDQLVIKIGDFGLVTAEDNDDNENLLERTKHTGTRSYMAPEQRNHISYDRRVDIYALGLIYFELLYNLSGMEKAKVWEEIKSQRLPQRFQTQFTIEHKLIESMLSPNPEHRPDARQLKMDLQSITVHVQQDNKTICHT